MIDGRWIDEDGLWGWHFVYNSCEIYLSKEFYYTTYTARYEMERNMLTANELILPLLHD
jgi:hypothetical protein